MKQQYKVDKLSSLMYFFAFKNYSYSTRNFASDKTDMLAPVKIII